MLAAALFALATFATPAPAPVTADSGEVVAAPARKAGVLRTPTRDVPVTLVRFDDPALPFITYLPEGQVAPAIVQTASGTEVSFVPTRRGRPIAGARATFLIPNASVSSDALRAVTFGTSGAVRQKGGTVSDAGVSPCLWAEEGRLVQFADATEGFVCVGSHLGTGFRLTVQAPSAEAAYLGAHVDVLLDELRWRLNGAGLE